MPRSYLSTSFSSFPLICARRAAIAKDGPPTFPEVNTLYEMFTKSAAKHAGNNCLGKRGASGDYEWLTYKEVAERSADIASAMSHVGVGPHARAGVYGANSPEWMLAMQACNRMTIYCVPLYDSLGESAIDYIISHSGEKLLQERGDGHFWNPCMPLPPGCTFYF